MLIDEMKGGECNRIVYPRCYNEIVERESGEKFPLVFVKYHDHVLFRNIRPVQIHIAEREAVGWLVYQNDDEIVVVADNSSKPLPFE